MKILRIVVLVLLLMPVKGYNQETFSKRIDVHDDDVGKSICQTSDGGYIITGSCYDGTYLKDDIVLLRTDEYGDTLWVKTFGYQGYDDVGVCVKETYDLGFVLAGTFKIHISPPNSAFIIKTDSVGDTLWMNTFGTNSLGKYVLQIPDSGYLLFGERLGSAFIQKFDNSGNKSWHKTYGGDYGEFISAQIVDNNSIIVVGTSDNPPCPYCTTIDLLKLNMNGDIIWSNRFGTDNYFAYSASQVIQTYDGGFLISGGYSYPVVLPIPYILKTDSDGNFSWDKSFEYTYGHLIESVVQQSDSGYVYLSYRNAGNGVSEMVLVKTDLEGNIVWDRGYMGDSLSNAGYDLVNTSDDYLISVGVTGLGASQDIFLLKTDYEGLLTNTDSYVDVKEWGDAFVHPNPFTNSTTIEYELTEPSHIQITIYNAIGETIYKAEDCLMPQGMHTFTWSPESLPEGLYYGVLRSGEGVSVVKMVKQ